MLRRYVYGPGLDEPIVTAEPGGVRKWHHQNVLGSVIALSGAAGAVLERHAYGPYGEAASLTGGAFRFAGRRLDAETGLYYNRARYYSPALGRFLQTDPIGYKGGLNLYAYVGNDPLNLVDPMGTKAGPASGSGGNWGLMAGATVAADYISGQGLAMATNVGRAALGVLALPLALSGDTPDERIYVTYTRQGPGGLVYSGRTSGIGTPESLVMQRGSQQAILNAEGFAPPQVDQFSTDRAAIRGREQQLIDYYGGAKSVGGSARNMINGVSDYNPNRPFYMYSAEAAFGALPDNSPDRLRIGK